MAESRLTDISGLSHTFDDAARAAIAGLSEALDR
jgi:hypothetical protein